MRRVKSVFAGLLLIQIIAVTLQGQITLQLLPQSRVDRNFRCVLTFSEKEPS